MKICGARHRNKFNGGGKGRFLEGERRTELEAIHEEVSVSYNIREGSSFLRIRKFNSLYIYNLNYAPDRANPYYHPSHSKNITETY